MTVSTREGSIDHALSEKSGSSWDAQSNDLEKTLARHSLDVWNSLCEHGQGGGGRCMSVSSPDKDKEDCKHPGGIALTYKTRNRISQGSTSVLYDGIRRSDGRKVALKAYRGSRLEDTLLAEQEYELLRQLSHPCIVSAFDMQSVRGHAVIVLERCEGSELERTVQRYASNTLSEAVSCTLTSQLVRGIEYLHRNKVVHCDVRPQNILVADDMRSLKLVDFGSALELQAGGRAFTLPQSGDQVLYLSPEVLLGEQPTLSSDVWQVGLCMHFMLTGGLPQGRDKCEDTHGAVRAVATHHVSFHQPLWKEISRQCRVVLRQCLTIDRLERPTSAYLVRKAEWLRAAMQGISTLLAGLEPAKQEGMDEGELKKLDGSMRDFAVPSAETMPSMRPPSTVSAGTNPSTHGSILSSALVASPRADSEATSRHRHLTPLPEADDVVVLLGTEQEMATILLVNNAERTYKVRQVQDGRIKVVSFEEVALV